jgi:rod shape determining protein RodA
MVRYPPVKIKNILLHTGLFAVVFLIIVRQPDLGSALVYLSMWLGLLVLAGIPLKYIIGAISLGGISLPIIYELLHDYQKKRISTFLNPLLDPKGAGYNAIQAMISVGSGQLFGRGFGRGTQSLLRFLPERHTDFIFASFSEEFGLIGSLVLLLIFFFMFLRLLKQASRKVNEPLAYLYISGLFIMLFTHVVINVGMNIGIVPITGITLPFVSAGGSSLITVFIGLGIYVSAIQRQRPYETARPSGL